MFGISADLKTESSYISTSGFHEVTIRRGDVRFEPLKAGGNPQICIYFTETSTGLQYRHIEWEPNPVREKERSDKKFNELVSEGKPPMQKNNTPHTLETYALAWLQDRANGIAKNLKHIMLEFGVPESKTVIAPSPTWQQFGANVVALFNQLSLTTPGVNIVLEYDKTNFVTLPYYPPFIASAEHIGKLQARVNGGKLRMLKTMPDAEGGSYSAAPMAAGPGVAPGATQYTAPASAQPVNQPGQAGGQAAQQDNNDDMPF